MERSVRFIKELLTILLISTVVVLVFAAMEWASGSPWTGPVLALLMLACYHSRPKPPPVPMDEKVRVIWNFARMAMKKYPDLANTREFNDFAVTWHDDFK